MSVVPMKLLTMAGPLERFDEVVRTCVIDQQFHPESTLQMMHGVKGLMALDYSNPYAALLRRAEEVADEAGVPLDYAPFDPSLDSDGLSAYFDQLEQEMLSLKRRQQTLSQPGGGVPHRSGAAGEPAGPWAPIWMSCGVWTMSASATAGCPGRPLTAFR